MSGLGSGAPSVMMPVRVTPALHEALRRLAFERSVSKNHLALSVLTAWVLSVTEPGDPLFSGSMATPLPEMPKEKYPGFFDSLKGDFSAP